MSVSQNSIKAFIQVLYAHSQVISLPDWNELLQLSHTLPKDDEEEISERLENWLQQESRSQLLETYKQNFKSISAESKIDLGTNLGIGNSKSQTPPNQPSPSSKELLDNAIKENSPLSDKQKSQQT